MARIVLVAVVVAVAGACVATSTGDGSGLHAWSATNHPSDLVVDQRTRDQFRQQAQPLYDAVTADQNNFAGIYSTDEGGPWRIVVRFIGDAPLANAMTLVAEDIPVEWIPARYSMAQLNKVFGDLMIQLGAEIRAQRVSQITPDEATNTVLIGLPDDNPDLQATLTQQYGHMISFKIVPVYVPIP